MNRIHIAVIEPSQIIFEGLSNILLKTKIHFYLYRVNDLEELAESTTAEDFRMVIINPSAVINRQSQLMEIKNKYPELSFIAIQYSFYQDELLRLFDDIIAITDSVETIVRKLDNLDIRDRKRRQNDLSKRETEVLTQLVKGLSNKEIADALNISTHTVITHRKNISEKTGIKSVSRF
ncbi:MAG: LuxR C-terminal-related transcriptional regulator [Bacteroidales bacterium]|nr:LuxR C-terminal-related transcriptional regulator [Bacteroidales bacterium]